MDLTTRRAFGAPALLLISLLGSCSSKSELSPANLQHHASSEKFTTAAILMGERQKLACETYQGAKRNRDKRFWSLVAPLEIDEGRTRSFEFAVQQANRALPRSRPWRRVAKLDPSSLILARSQIQSIRGTDPVFCLFTLQEGELKILSRCPAGQERECMDLAYASAR